MSTKSVAQKLFDRLRQSIRRKNSEDHFLAESVSALPDPEPDMMRYLTPESAKLAKRLNVLGRDLRAGIRVRDLYSLEQPSSNWRVLWFSLPSDDRERLTKVFKALQLPYTANVRVKHIRNKTFDQLLKETGISIHDAAMVKAIFDQSAK